MKLLKTLCFFLPLGFGLGFISAQSLTWNWVAFGYGGYYNFGSNIFIDHDSSIYTSLSIHDDWYVGSFSHQLSSRDPTDADVLVWKLDENGHTQWLNSYGTNWLDQGQFIGRDMDNRLFTQCNIRKPFASQPPPLDTLGIGGYRFYIDEQGNWLDAQPFSTQVKQVDAKGRELIIGSLQVGDSLIYGNDTVFGPPIGTIPVYPEKYIALIDSSTGNYWGKHIGSYLSQMPLHLRFLDKNSILMVGVSQNLGTIQCGNPTFKEGIFWAIYDSLGNCQSYHSLGAIQPSASRLIINDQKEIYLLGSYTTTLTFGGKTWNSAAGSGGNFCVIKLDRYGNVLWVNASEGLGSGPYVTSMVQDMNGNVILGGSDWGKYSIDQQPFGSDTVRDIFICSFSAVDGKLMWIKESDTHQPTHYYWANLHELAVTKENHLLVMGNFLTPTYTLGRHVMTFQSKQNLFIASLNLNRTKSLSPNFPSTCPIHLTYTSGQLLVRDECPEKRVDYVRLLALSGQEISIVGLEHLANGYMLHTKPLPPGVYLLSWERLGGEYGFQKFVVFE